ncbi:hypothetical protein VOM14_27625 [Paraburkholderia sp. MPAMCS5]|nr:hypothetical protein [Paraburkholderia sp. MPAMCS5]
MGTLIALGGTAVFGRGIFLAPAGGGWYDEFAGTGFFITGLALATGRPWVRGWHAMFLFVTLQWTLLEAHPLSWELEARIIVGVVAGAMLLLPAVGRDLIASPCGCVTLIGRTERSLLWFDAAPAALAASVLLSIAACGLTICFRYAGVDGVTQVASRNAPQLALAVKGQTNSVVSKTNECFNSRIQTARSSCVYRASM